MAEKSFLWTTGGVTGDQQESYSQSNDSTIKKILAACSGFEGVAPGYLNELACAPNGLNKVSVDTGGAVVDGKVYLNDASQDVTIPSAVGAGNTRIDRIVLRADWTNFNVSVHRIAGTDAGSPVAPDITQTSETTYDIKLYQALVTTGGVVTVTDERTWARVPVDDTSVSFFSGTLRVKDVGITAAKIATNAVETAKIKDLNITAAKLASNAVETAKIKDGQVTNNKIADGTITEAKLNTTAKIFDPPAAAIAYNASLGPQSIPNGSWTLVNLAVIDYIKGDISTSELNKRIVIDKAGLYLLTGQVGFAGNGTGIRGLAIYRNGSLLKSVSLNGSSDGNNLAISVVMPIAATHFLQMFVYQNSGVSLDLINSNLPTLTATYLRN